MTEVRNIGRNTRSEVNYTYQEKKIMRLEVNVLNSQIDLKREKGVSCIYLQQENIGIKVRASFNTMPRKLINVLVIAALY